jgi:hypothetical protein
MSAPHRSLWPREHGAYAQLAAPLLAALIARVPTVPAALLAVAAVCAFLANEPLLVALGHRGERLRSAAGARAWRRCIALAGVAGAAGLTGLAMASQATLSTAVVSLVLACVLIALAYRRGQHSLTGELFAAVALPMAAAPVAVASGTAPGVALGQALVWGLGFAASVASVHRVIARNKTPAGRIDRVLAVGFVVALVVLLVVVPCVHLVAIALPLIAVSAALVIHPPRARHLRAIGVALVVASVASTVTQLVAGS